MDYAQKMKFLSWLLLKQNPKMLIKPCLNKRYFNMISFKTLNRASYDKNAFDNAWMYAFVNKSKKMHKITFSSYDELLDAMFDADEIWYGSERYKNALYNKKNEMIVEYDFTENI